jgi:hypothetical protein
VTSGPRVGGSSLGALWAGGQGARCGNRGPGRRAGAAGSGGGRRSGTGSAGLGDTRKRIGLRCGRQPGASEERAPAE